jgi:hypothetical protein
MINYSFNGRRRPINSETLLVIDFMNLKINPTPSFGCAHKDRVCVFINTCTSIYVYTVFLKKFIYLHG